MITAFTVNKPPEIFTDIWNNINRTFIPQQYFRVGIPINKLNMTKVAEAFRVLGFDAKIGICDFSTLKSPGEPMTLSWCDYQEGHECPCMKQSCKERKRSTELFLTLSWPSMSDDERQKLATALNHVFLCDHPMTQARFKSLKSEQLWQKIIRCCTILGKEIRLCD